MTGSAVNGEDVLQDTLLKALQARAQGAEVDNLGDLFRRIWATGDAGVDVPMTISREGRVFDVHVASTDRNRLLKGPTLQ